MVIVTYDSAGVVGRCLDALPRAIGGLLAELIVVDNASHDDTRQVVAERAPGVRLISNVRNVGFAAANNTAIDVARGRHLLLLNPDTTPGPGSLELLVKTADDRHGVGVVAPRLLDADLTDQGTARTFPSVAAAIFGRRSFLTRRFPSNPWSRRYLAGRDHTGDAPFDVDWVSGACMLVPRVVIDEVGPLDPGFFMYWEDADWCRRIGAAGHTVTTVPLAEVVHEEGATSRVVPLRQILWFHQSAYRYYAKHHLRGWRAIGRPAAAGVLALRAGAVAVAARRGGPAREAAA